MSYDNPPPPPPPQYGAPMPGAPGANHPRATLILVLGILSIPCCGLFTGIPAIILGNTAKKEIAASGGTTAAPEPSTPATSAASSARCCR